MAIIVGILSATAGATVQLTDVFGPGVARAIVSVANLAMTIVVTPFLFAVTGQTAQIKAVNNMPGVQSIVVNKEASTNLAAIAVDPNSKVEAAPGAEKAVEATAKGTS